MRSSSLLSLIFAACRVRESDKVTAITVTSNSEVSRPNQAKKLVDGLYQRSNAIKNSLFSAYENKLTRTYSSKSTYFNAKMCNFR